MLKPMFPQLFATLRYFLLLTNVRLAPVTPGVPVTEVWLELVELPTLDLKIVSNWRLINLFKRHNKMKNLLLTSHSQFFRRIF
ncbi:hypothetical protein BC830DRAFT_1144233 [Chytriomyces sp. MP71]|nr:hypothetical protein BC830DRAFT_1144233 [Chytriomyces sp. MP71]